MLESLEQATICMINGHAVGGGWGLTLACDFRIAAAEAQLWIPEVDLGVPLGVASTTRFVRMVGPARAKEIIMSCRRYTAAEACTLGLVTQVVPVRLAGRRRPRLRRDAAQEALPPACRGQGADQRDRADGNPRGQRDDRGLPGPRVTRRFAGPPRCGHCFAGIPVDCQETNSSPDGRFAQIAVKRSGTVRSCPADVTSYTAVPVMIATQP